MEIDGIMAARKSRILLWHRMAESDDIPGEPGIFSCLESRTESQCMLSADMAAAAAVVDKTVSLIRVMVRQETEM